MMRSLNQGNKLLIKATQINHKDLIKMLTLMNYNRKTDSMNQQFIS